MWREWLIFPKAIAGGVAAVILMWVVILCYSIWRDAVRNRAAGVVGLGAASGGWNALLHSPLVLLLLMVAFLVGLYLTSRR
jgi:chromate transport protein ChrA